MRTMTKKQLAIRNEQFMDGIKWALGDELVELCGPIDEPKQSGGAPNVTEIANALNALGYGNYSMTYLQKLRSVAHTFPPGKRHIYAGGAQPTKDEEARERRWQASLAERKAEYSANPTLPFPTIVALVTLPTMMGISPSWSNRTGEKLNPCRPIFDHLLHEARPAITDKRKYQWPYEPTQ